MVSVCFEQFCKSQNYYYYCLCLSFVSYGRCTNNWSSGKERKKKKKQGPVVQRVVSLTSLLRVISLTVLADSIYNILIFFAEKT